MNYLKLAHELLFRLAVGLTLGYGSCLLVFVDAPQKCGAFLTAQFY